MAHQSPMISIPKKVTEEVDWTTPIRNLIAQSYGESPDNYAAECVALQRCRQDAVKGAGSDMTARDLLYKYFGQLELLELRFSEIRVTFPWHDAFTSKLITQTSIAYEKASILFQIAATHSSIASSQNRSDPEGLKRAFHYLRTCAGMLTYINENFLHAPSTDLSREVIKFLVNIIMAQATEVAFEKCTDEKKGNALVSKIGAQAAAMYTSLGEEVKEFMGKGIFDRNWVTLIQIKSKYFSSLSQYYRAQADTSAGKHGDSLVRYNLAETLAKEASRNASSFASMFLPNMSPNLPADAGPSIQERTKSHLALCSDRRAEAQRENDLIYNAVLPAAEALTPIDKAVVATPIPIQDVYGAPDVQKVIGPDIFLKLIPLSVHESASVYSEEKAKLVRGEVEKAETAEGEAKSALDGLGVKEGLGRFKAMAEGEVGGDQEIPLEVRRWREDISVMEEREPVEGIFSELNRLKDRVRRELDGISRELEIESKDCEMMRVKYDLWTQTPSASHTKSLRQDLKSHFSALEAAAASDQQVSNIWESVQSDIGTLLSPDIEEVFRASAERGGPSATEHLLDLDVGAEADDEQERAKIAFYVGEIEERLSRMTKISKERGEVLKDLKDKIQTDDVSHLLLLNRRNTGVEPTLFASELEKFRSYQQRLASTVHHQQQTLQETASIWKTLKDLAGRGPGARKWEEREKRKKETVKRFSRARDGYMEVRDGLAKGLQFYTDLTELTVTLRRNVKSFVSSRTVERETLAAQLEVDKRLSAPTSPPPLASKPPLPPPPSVPSLDSSFASMNIRATPTPQRPGPQWTNNHSSSPGPSQQSYTSPAPSQYNRAPPPPPESSSQPSYFPAPPPPVPAPAPYPPPPPADPYAGLGMFGSSQYPPQPSQNQNQAQSPQGPPAGSLQYGQQHNRQTLLSYGQPQSPYPLPPPPPSQPAYAYPQQQSPQQFSSQSPFPPPPQPVNYNYASAAPPIQQQQKPYQQFQPSAPPSQQGYGQQQQQYHPGYGR